MKKKKTAPNSVLVLVLGIISIAFNSKFIGLILGIVGLIYANKGLKDYNATPELYKGNGMLNIGKIASIIGIILGCIALVLRLIFRKLFCSAFESFTSSWF